MYIQHFWSKLAGQRVRHAAGFTLIELLTVIAIIALLAAIILASLNTARQKSRDGKRVADIKTIELALSLYYNDNSKYPANIYASSGGLAPVYIPVVPLDPNAQSTVTQATCGTTPTTAGCYGYAAGGSGSSCSSFHLWATLEQSTNSALSADTDSAAASAVCTGSRTDVAGTDPIYDVHS